MTTKTPKRTRQAKKLMGIAPDGPIKLKARAPHVAAFDDPKRELEFLVNQHQALTKSAVALEHMCRDRVAQRDIVQNGVLLHKKGAKIPCRLPADEQQKGQEFADEVFKKAAKRLESAMLQQLRQLPIFQVYLSKLFGLKSGGPVAAYLVSKIDIRRCEKPSGLRRFCGMAVIDGRLERRTKGQASGFSTEMRTRLYQLFDSMWQNRRHDPENKYLRIWRDSVHRIEHSERVFDRGVDKEGKWTGSIKVGEKVVSARGFAHSYGWHKAADVFLEDLYVVWRAIEGLPVWPSYYAAKLGYAHGGKICVNEPRMLTVDEALAMVGCPGAETSEAAAE